MAIYNRLQRLSLILRTDTTEPLGTYKAFGFPQPWAQQLRQNVFRRSQSNGEDDEWSGLPLWALNNGIAALLPQVLVTDASGHQGRTWLAWNHQDGSPAPDTELLVELVRSGLVVAADAMNEKARLRGRRQPVEMADLAAVLRGFKPTDLRCEARQATIRKDLPPRREDYSVIPNLLASRLVAAHWEVHHQGWKKETAEGPQTPEPYGISRWRRVSSPEGAEMISWPPHCYTSSNGTRYLWSYTLRLSLQNHALDPSGDALVHARIGVRRWARNNVWDGQRSITAFLFTPSPWADETSPFGRAGLRWRPGPKGKKEGKMVWDDVLAPTLARMSSQRYLPSAADLASAPDSFLHPGGGENPVAGIVFRDGLGEYSNHSIGTGASARDRWQIFRHLCSALTDVAEPEPALHRLPVPVRSRTSADEMLRIDLGALTQATSSKIVIDVLCDTTVMRDLVVKTLHAALGLPSPSPNPLHTGSDLVEQVLSCGDIEVLLRTQPIGELASALTVDSSIKNRRDRVRKATAPRRALATERLSRGCLEGMPRFALVEMGNVNAYPSSEHDPKEAVKAAATALGVLTQNITPPKPTGTAPGCESAATRAQRAGKAVMDLLVRQTGLLRRPQQPAIADTPLIDVTAVGLWVVRRNKEHRALLPVAVSHAPDEPFARIRMPHTDAWLPFRQGLLSLGDFDIERRLEHEQVQDFFGQVVDELSDGSDIALLTLAQNLRSTCPGIANGPLRPDVLAFNPKQPIPPARRKGLRHIRLRTNVRDETSQHYSFTDGALDGEVGVGSHFWVDPRRPRHFFSTAKKPATAASGSPGGSRIEAHWACTGKDKEGNKTYGMRHDTLQDVWNPQLLELLVACHAPTDSPKAWAALVHQQRYEAGHFSDPLALPAVLHLAYTVGKHLLPDYLLEPITESDA
ncbi:RNaseH domain-containing protein [Streptomyces sp. NPDC058157]|uniref:RNaseH domain-containing protein n=1 Tax=Streptomyces sp. NPDC058157 TaxID=3346360 RepID=UPI0036EF4F50